MSNTFSHLFFHQNVSHISCHFLKLTHSLIFYILNSLLSVTPEHAKPLNNTIVYVVYHKDFSEKVELLASFLRQLLFHSFFFFFAFFF